VKAAADTCASLKTIQNLHPKRLQRTICVLEDLCAQPDLSELKFVHVVVSFVGQHMHSLESKHVRARIQSRAARAAQAPVEMCALTVKHTGAEDDSRWHPQPCVGCQHGEEYVQVDL